MLDPFCPVSTKKMSFPSAPAAAAAAAAASVSADDRSAFYKMLESDAAALLSSSPHRDATALCANIAALLYRAFDAKFGERSKGPGAAVNWAGFYLLRAIEPDEANIDHSIVDAAAADASAALPTPPSQALVLGPFHGAPAVSLIRLSKGVCGAAASTEQVQLVPDVHARPDHIACDSRSRSELVIPIYAASEDEEVAVRKAGAVTVAEAAAAVAATAGGSSGSAASSRGRLVGVLDMDSPQLAFFREQDAECLGRIAAALGRAADWGPIIDQRVRVRFPVDASCTLSKRH
jgi:putative methionine-R-sulfoxide reductase with GAF domain